jgi:cytochrome c553
MMKFISLKVAIWALVASSVSSFAAGLEGAQPRNCTWCHGVSAQGYAPAPRLAGQRPLYIESQLRSFRAHTRDNPFSKQYMWGAAANLNANEIRSLATFFSSLTAKPAGDGDMQKVAAGKVLFQDGNPSANTVACAVCHGPNAQGIRDIPRIGGLSSAYLKRKLEQWKEGYHATAKSPMPQIARTLSADQIEAVAAYLSFVE